MADRFYGYQYDTNPRKLNTEYAPYRKRYPQKEEPVTTTSNRSKNTKGNRVGANSRTNRYNRAERTKELQERNFPEYGRKQVVNKSRRVYDDAKSINQRKMSNDSFEDEQNDIQNVKKTKTNVKAKLKIVMFLVAGFSVLFAISYQNSLISESFNKKEQYKKEMEALSKTNQQIEVSIENNLNLNNIEQAAKEKIGMQKLNNDQKIYVNLPKEDFVAPASEQVVIEEDSNFFDKLLKGFTTSIR